MILYHVTTGRKAKLYRHSGAIHGPVRGFDSLPAAMLWAMKVGRKVIYRFEPRGVVHRLPDHHNEYGSAWWTDTVAIQDIACECSAEQDWDQP